MTSWEGGTCPGDSVRYQEEVGGAERGGKLGRRQRWRRPGNVEQRMDLKKKKKRLQESPRVHGFVSVNTPALACCFCTPNSTLPFSPKALHSVVFSLVLRSGPSNLHAAVLPFTVPEGTFRSARPPMSQHRLLMVSCRATSPQEGDSGLGLPLCLALLPGWKPVGLC